MREKVGDDGRGKRGKGHTTRPEAHEETDEKQVKNERPGDREIESLTETERLTGRPEQQVTGVREQVQTKEEISLSA